MIKHKIALIGFGTVGQGFTEILLEKKTFLKNRYGFEFDVVGISDIAYGTVYNPDGLDLYEILEDVRIGRSFTRDTRSWQALDLIRDSNATVVCEMTYTNFKIGEPAISHCKMALNNGKSVVTCNKGPAALAYNELKTLADSKGLKFFIEGTVMSGTPLINLTEGPLAGCEIIAAQGILNGTTNYILTRMEAGLTYEDALNEAQRLGYAEADPTGDVEGYDSRGKLTIIANVVMNTSLKLEEVTCKGITGITRMDIEQASLEGCRWKLIGTAKKEGSKVIASVAPKKIPLSHPLAGVMGAVNAVTFTTELLGDVSIMGPGAGRKETGFSILNDILRLK